jgi:hypothetical protein
MAPAIAAMASILFRMINSLCDDARRFAPARNPTQFIARGIVPGNNGFHPLQFSASFASAGTHCSDKRLLSWNCA